MTKRVSGFRFELPGIFRNLWGTSPPFKASIEHRNAADAVSQPIYGFYNPDDLVFPRAMVPVVPTSGGYQTLGGGMVKYDHQALWDRGDECDTGPVRKTIGSWMDDHRVRHV